jgi:hypothetical protein
LVVLASFIQISRTFYKGVNMANTQNTARNITQGIENDIRYASTTPSNVSAAGGTASGSFCIGAHHYSYFLGRQYPNQIQSGIYRETVSGCPASATTTGTQLLSSGMQLNHIELTCQNGRCNIQILLEFYGGNPNGLFASARGFSPAYQADDAQCTGALNSSQFCVSVYYRRTVLQYM